MLDVDSDSESIAASEASSVASVRTSLQVPQTGDISRILENTYKDGRY